jgi:hypothetical protein
MSQVEWAHWLAALRKNQNTLAYPYKGLAKAKI